MRVLEVEQHRLEAALGAHPGRDRRDGAFEAVLGVEPLVERAIPADAEQGREDRARLVELAADRGERLGQALDQPVEGVVEADVVLFLPARGRLVEVLFQGALEGVERALQRLIAGRFDPEEALRMRGLELAPEGLDQVALAEAGLAVDVDAAREAAGPSALASDLFEDRRHRGLEPGELLLAPDELLGRELFLDARRLLAPERVERYRPVEALELEVPLGLQLVGLLGVRHHPGVAVESRSTGRASSSARRGWWRGPGRRTRGGAPRR